MVLKIREKREKLKLTQVEFAKKIGVSQSTIAMWETGKSNPRADKLLELAFFFDCTIDEILEREETE